MTSREAITSGRPRHCSLERSRTTDWPDADEAVSLVRTDLSRPDLRVFVFGGDGDIFSIGGNHFTHTARKNIKLTCVAMDNQVYGLTKKQTSPTSPLGYRSKTDQWGAVDQPINPLKQAIAAGATFVARTSHTNPNHVLLNTSNNILNPDAWMTMFWKVTGSAFILFATSHGLHGLLSVVEDYITRPWVRRTLRILVMVLTLVMIGIGIYVLWTS
jgi:succinate dehydrogenase hydrophobic anchor subunit